MRKYIPFKYENKWGIIDSSKVEIQEPKYNKLHLFDDFTYAEMDGEIIYNLKTGESFPAFGEYKSSAEIAEKKNYLFTNNGNSVLINFENKDSIKLINKYQTIRNFDLYNEKTKKTSSLIFGYLSYDEKN